MATIRRQEEAARSVPLKSPAPVLASATNRPQHPTASGPSSPASQREDQLRAELVSLRQINQTISSMLVSLGKAGSDLETVQHTLGDGIQLVDLYTDILSQSHHTTKLMLDPEWGGVSKDMEAINKGERRREDEERSRANRQELEERQRAEREEERRRQVEAREDVETQSKGRGGSRGRGRGRGIGRGSGRPPSSASSTAGVLGGRLTGVAAGSESHSANRGRNNLTSRGRTG